MFKKIDKWTRKDVIKYLQDLPSWDSEKEQDRILFFLKSFGNHPVLVCSIISSLDTLEYKTASDIAKRIADSYPGDMSSGNQMVRLTETLQLLHLLEIAEISEMKDKLKRRAVGYRLNGESGFYLYLSLSTISQLASTDVYTFPDLAELFVYYSKLSPLVIDQNGVAGTFKYHRLLKSLISAEIDILDCFVILAQIGKELQHGMNNKDIINVVVKELDILDVSGQYSERYLATQREQVYVYDEPNEIVSEDTIMELIVQLNPNFGHKLSKSMAKTLKNRIYHLGMRTVSIKFLKSLVSEYIRNQITDTDLSLAIEYLEQAKASKDPISKGDLIVSCGLSLGRTIIGLAGFPPLSKIEEIGSELLVRPSKYLQKINLDPLARRLLVLTLHTTYSNIAQLNESLVQIKREMKQGSKAIIRQTVTDSEERKIQEEKHAVNDKVFSEVIQDAFNEKGFDEIIEQLSILIDSIQSSL